MATEPGLARAHRAARAGLMTVTTVNSASVTGGRPMYLGLEPSGTLMFMHEPAADARGGSTAVLLCPPFGWEEVCCSRSLRSAAARLARAGHPTARLTLPGTGDSAGGPRDGDLLRQWIEAVGAAATWLRERTDAARCLAFGIGLGGMLAYLAAREYRAIDDLALWAVPDRGRTLLREAKSLSKAISSDFPDEHASDPAAAGDLGLIGYLMTAETEAALADLQLSALPLAGCDQRRVLLLSRGAAPGRSATPGEPRAPGRGRGGSPDHRLLRPDGQTRAVGDAGGHDRPRPGLAGARHRCRGVRVGATAHDAPARVGDAQARGRWRDR